MVSMLMHALARRSLAFAALIGLLLVSSWSDSALATSNSITTLATWANDSSLALDAAGNPVIAYEDALLPGSLQILHCNDPICTGGGESLSAPDFQRGQFPSLTLDGSGNPVVSYYTTVFDRLKVLHCNDPNCVGGGDSVSTPDPDTFLVEWPTSMALDASGNPVIAYAILASSLRIMRCNDPNCTGNDESITVHDNFAAAPSIALDAADNPIVAYYVRTGLNYSTGALKVMHCNDPNCAGGDESITTPDSDGTWPSMRLDASGYPVIAYYSGATTGDLKIMHCNDVDCTGSNESITAPDSAGDVGLQPSLVLDGTDPVVTYRDETNGELKLLRCDDPNCAAGGDLIISLDASSDAGHNSSLVLDAAGYPAASYDAGSDLALQRCTDANCKGVLPTPTIDPAVGGIAELPDVTGALPQQAASSPGRTGLLVAAIATIAAFTTLALAALRVRQRSTQTP